MAICISTQQQHYYGYCSAVPDRMSMSMDHQGIRDLLPTLHTRLPAATNLQILQTVTEAKKHTLHTADSGDCKLQLPKVWALHAAVLL